MSGVSNMPSLRPRTSTTTPILSDVMYRISAAESMSVIAAETKAVAKYFKEDPDAIAQFWLGGYRYDLMNENHCEVLRWLFVTVGLKQENVVEFLDTLNRGSLANLGVVRVVGEKSTFYRIRVGEVS